MTRDAAVGRDAATPPDAARPGPRGCIQGAFTAFRGNVHAHTGYSDGERTPADAFAHARDVAGLDIQVVTDHLEQLYWPDPWDRWGRCQEQADAADAPGTFLAACGFEYGSGFSALASTGHNNVFFSPGLFPAVQTDFRDFYRSLAACTECVGQFNHPGDEREQHWNHFEYVPEADVRLQLFELNQGVDASWDLLFAALDAGWHLSPVSNQDNHSANWGTANDSRTGFYMAALDRESLREAMLARRTFASRDKNADIRVMANGTCWMGSVLEGYPALTLSFEVSDPDEGDGFTDVTFHGPGGAVLHTHPCGGAATCAGALSLDVTAPTYILARAHQEDGDFLVSAPTWARP
jgi:hypothetical protein